MKWMATILSVGAVFAVGTACEQSSPVSPAPDAALAPVLASEGASSTRISGGGQIRSETSAGEESNVSMAGNVETAGLDGTVEWVIQFHHVSNADVDGGTFQATSLLDANFFNSTNTGECVGAMNMTLAGTFNGESGWSAIVRLGDAGKIKVDDVDDTARVQLSNSDGSVYDTHLSDFPDESNCVGSARTKLDKGNLKIS